MVKEKVIEKKRTTSVAVVGGYVKSVRFVSTEKTGFRVMKDGKIGIYGMTGKADEATAWKKAEENLANGLPYPCDSEKDNVKHVDNTPNLLDDKTFVSEAERFLAILRKDCPNFIFSQMIKKVEFSQSIANDCNLDLSYRSGYYIVSLVIKEASSANVFDLGYSYVGREFSVEKMAENIREYYRAYYVSADIEEGEKLVIGSESAFGFDKILSDMTADKYCTGTGLLNGKAGTKIFDEKVTVYADMTEDNWQTPFFDDEGVIPEDGKNYMIKDGVFVAPIACKSDAKKYGLKKAGFASSAYDGAPQTGVSSLVAKSSGKTLEELTGGEDAILLSMASGGDTTPDGNFATPVQVAFLVRNGKLVGRLPALNISGNVFDTYGKNFVGKATNSPLDLVDGEGGNPVVVRINVSK